MGWTFVYLFVVLKIPVALAFYLVWWACKAPEESQEEPSAADGGGGGHSPRPSTPRLPRRGPHADPPPSPPSRVRAAGRSAKTRA